MRRMLFGGLVIVVYSVLAYARRFSAGCDGACSPEGLEYAFLVSLEVFVAASIVFLGAKLYHEVWYGDSHSLDATGGSPAPLVSDRCSSDPRQLEGRIRAKLRMLR
jgi:hypothetical protein